jgi:outer membrane protein assembly factor BamA
MKRRSLFLGIFLIFFCITRFSQTSIKQKIEEFKDGQHIISEVNFEGLDSDFDNFDGIVRVRDVLREFRENRVGISVGEKFYSKNTENGLKTLKSFLYAEGYPEAEIKVLGQKLPKNKIVIIFQVKRGPRKLVTEIQFTGLKNFTNQELLTDLKQCSKDSLEIYEARRFDYYLFKCTRQYLASKGYFKAKIESKNAIPMSTGFVVTIQISEGIRYRLGEIKLNGLHFFKRKEIFESFGQAQGDIFDSKVFSEYFYEKLKEKYDANGYAEYTAELDSEIINPEVEGLDGILNITVDINEGKQFKLLNVKIFGVDNKKATEIRKMLSLNDGDLFNIAELKKWIETINKTNEYYFLGADRDIEIRTDPEKGEISLALKVKLIQ